MPKLRCIISLLIFLSAFILQNPAAAQTKYKLLIQGVDKSADSIVQFAGLQTEFLKKSDCVAYVNKLPSLLQTKGFVTASVDSVHYDSTSATVVLFLGEAWKWALLDVQSVNPSLLNAVGWKEKNFTARQIDFKEIANWQERILNYLENNGHPFGKVYIDSLDVQDDKVRASLKVNEGPLYKIDSIALHGNAKVSPTFIKRYLDIPDGSVYSKEKLERISKKILELPYVEEEQPANLTMLVTGSALNLYLKPKRSNQVNVLIGFLPNSDQLSEKKLLINGEGNINLKNSFGNGETIGFSFQKLLAKSSNINLIFQQPYLFNSPFGLDFLFEMYQQDTSYVNINMQLGANYYFSQKQTAKVYLQRFQTIANGINTNYILQNRRLPDEADVSHTSLGIDYFYNNTDYIRNPTRGFDFLISTSVGTKKIKKNGQVLELKDDNDPNFDFGSLYDTVKLNTYQLRIKANGAKYLPLGRQSTIKLGGNGGFLQSGNIFRNELFQIGGFKLLRGFDEASQFVSQYAIGTVEYHYLINLNSYFYGFTDAGWSKNKSQNNNINHTYLSAGIGIALERKAGVFNLAWAVGKRNDIPFNFRQSKIHFGFVNYF